MAGIMEGTQRLSASTGLAVRSGHSDNAGHSNYLGRRAPRRPA